MCGVLSNGTSSGTQVSSARSPGGADWIANEQVRQAEQLAGIGPVTASAVVATVGDCMQIRNGRQFGTWLGLTPRQNSSGGKNNLGTKHIAIV